MKPNSLIAKADANVFPVLVRVKGVRRFFEKNSIFLKSLLWIGSIFSFRIPDGIECGGVMTLALQSLVVTPRLSWF